jgi:hypothetical protein
MSTEEIISRISCSIANPSEAIYSISMQTVITEIVHRMGIQALSLTSEDLQLAAEEVKEAIHHGLDYRPFIEEGLDVWEITRHL